MFTNSKMFTPCSRIFQNYFFGFLFLCFIVNVVWSPCAIAAANTVNEINTAHPSLNIQQWNTANGARVYFVAAPEIPIVDIAVVFRAGSARDEKKPGLARLTNVMLENGAKDLNADQIADQLDKVGAIYSKEINRDMAIVKLRSLTSPPFLNPALQIFTRLITSPTFPETNLKGEKQQALNAIHQKDDSLSSLANDAFFQRLYGDKPYGHPVIGTRDSVANIKREDLQTFYSRYYVAKNAVV